MPPMSLSQLDVDAIRVATMVGDVDVDSHRSTRPTLLYFY